MMKLIVTVGALALLSSGAYAADLVPAPQAAAEMAAVNWTGPYIGANVGYGPGTASGGVGYDEEFGSGVSFSGLFVGGQVGYNYQLANGLVFGGEADLNWSDESGTTGISEGDESLGITNRLNWFGAITGHVGYAWDNVMPYVLGGVAFANNTFGENCGIDGPCEPGEDISATGNHMGYTVGAGVTSMFTNSLSGFLEVRYSDYGSANYTFNPEPGLSETLPISLVDTTVRAGLNFHF